MVVNCGESMIVFHKTLTALIHVTATRMKMDEGKLVCNAILLYCNAVDDGIHPENELLRVEADGSETNLVGWKGEYYENERTTEEKSDSRTEGEVPALRGHHPVKA